MRAFFSIALAVAALCSTSCYAEAGPWSETLADVRKTRDDGQVSSVLTIDNDTLLLRNRDGFYTGGLRFAQDYSLREGNELTSYGWRIGQDLYTASDIKLPPERIAARDHPYAAWLFAGVFKDLRRTDGSGYRIGLDIGCLGPCAGGEATQKAIHRVLGQPLPQGWRRQVGNEIGAVVYADYVPIRWTLSPVVDVAPNIHARFGNIHADAGAGLLVRAGRLNTMPDQPTLHCFGRFDARAVGYNASLQGGYFSDDNLHTVKPTRVVGEIELGLVWSSEHYGVVASILRRGNEISALSSAVGSQNFARLQFAYMP